MEDETRELLEWYEEIYGSSEFREVRDICREMAPLLEEYDHVCDILYPDPVIVTTNHTGGER